MSSSKKYHFRFYDWEEKLRDKPFLRQPFGDNWEVYTWGEAGLMARKLATGLKSLGFRKRQPHRFNVKKLSRMDYSRFGDYNGRLCFSAIFP